MDYPHRWTREESQTIRQLFLLGWGRARIAKQFNVSPDAIAGRLTHMNLRRKNLPVADNNKPA